MFIIKIKHIKQNKHCHEMLEGTRGGAHVTKATLHLKQSETELRVLYNSANRSMPELNITNNQKSKFHEKCEWTSVLASYFICHTQDKTWLKG